MKIVSQHLISVEFIGGFQRGGGGRAGVNVPFLWVKYDFFFNFINVCLKAIFPICNLYSIIILNKCFKISYLIEFRTTNLNLVFINKALTIFCQGKVLPSSSGVCFTDLKCGKLKINK